LLRAFVVPPKPIDLDWVHVGQALFNVLAMTPVVGLDSLLGPAPCLTIEEIDFGGLKRSPLVGIGVSPLPLIVSPPIIVLVDHGQLSSNGLQLPRVWQLLI
jgi:hypothetical protein